MVGELVHRALCPHITFDFLYTPRLNDLKNEGGPFLYRGGWGHFCKALDNALPVFGIKRDKQ